VGQHLSQSCLCRRAITSPRCITSSAPVGQTQDTAGAFLTELFITASSFDQCAAVDANRMRLRYDDATSIPLSNFAPVPSGRGFSFCSAPVAPAGDAIGSACAPEPQFAQSFNVGGQRLSEWGASSRPRRWNAHKQRRGLLLGKTLPRPFLPRPGLF
jgi:hypothetical protein